MIWAKTDAGRVEMQTRALIKDRARRNLLLLIDGGKSEEMLLANLVGITAEDFQELRKLDLIAPAAGGVTVGNAPREVHVDLSTVPQALPETSLDYGQFTAALTRLISAHLGLRGFTLTLAVEKAGTAEELQAVAQRTLDLIRDRKGEAVAADARRTLYGG
ncbi:MAG: hypothetical protein ABI143_11250 [Caldimonas sp.]